MHKQKKLTDKQKSSPKTPLMIKNGGVDKSEWNFKQFITDSEMQLKPIVSAYWDCVLKEVVDDSPVSTEFKPKVTFQKAPMDDDLLFKHKWKGIYPENTFLTVSIWKGYKWVYLSESEARVKWITINQLYPRLYNWINIADSTCSIPETIIDRYNYEATMNKYDLLDRFKHRYFSDNLDLFDELGLLNKFIYTPSRELKFKATPIDDTWLVKKRSKEEIILAFGNGIVDVVYRGKTLDDFNIEMIKHCIPNVKFVARVSKLTQNVEGVETLTAVSIDMRFAETLVRKHKKINVEDITT